jgi:hypothetical protein
MAMGGVGEAMLLGAAMGGGSAAITGGDPLKGALLGGLTGGAGAGIGGALGGAAGTTAGTLGTEAALTGTGLTAGAAPGLTAGTAGSTLGSGFGNSLAAFDTGVGAGMNTAFSAAPQGLSAAGGSMGLNPAVAQSAMQSGTNFALNAPSIAPGSSAGIANLPAAAPSVAAPAASAASATPASFYTDPMKYIGEHKFLAGSSALAGAMGAKEDPYSPEEYNGPLKRFRLSSDYRGVTPYAEGGITDLTAGGYDRMVGEEPMYQQAMAQGGISNLGSYSDYARGGRMLKGPGDGMSDSIPASIAGKRPARLATEEFVVPADVVSHLGNGSSDAGAKQLYAMMDRVRTARTGRKSQGREISPQKYMAA